VIGTLKTNKQILKALQNLPKGLYETYDRILLAIPEDDVDLARRTLSMLMASHRPMRLRELVEALAVDMEELGQLDRDSMLNDERDLITICSSLIEYDRSNIISLAHQSVRVSVYQPHKCNAILTSSLYQEYLLSSHLEQHSQLSLFNLSDGQSNQEFAEVSLAYILSDCFKGGPCGSMSSLNQRHAEFTFLRYVSEFWAVHVEKSEGSDSVFELLMTLVFSHESAPNFWSLLEATPGVSAWDWDRSYSPHKVLTNYKFTWVLKRLEDQSWFNEELGKHGTPLTNAVWRDDIEMVNFLLDAGVDINKPCAIHIASPGAFPLHLATSHGFHQSFDLLINRGANLTQHLPDLTTSLHMACNQGSLPMMSKLALGSDINQPTADGRNPLVFATMSGSLDAVKFLVEAGAKLGSGKTALQWAVEMQSTDIIEYLLEKFAGAEKSWELTDQQVEWVSRQPRLAHKSGESFRSLRRPAGSASSDVVQTLYILQLRLQLPEGLALKILDEAEFWVYARSKKDEALHVYQDTPLEAYLVLAVHRPLVRRIVFRTTSHDQGEYTLSTIKKI
jgi:hypothetical protein